MAKKAARLWTESEVAGKLARRFSEPAWAFLRQVRSGVGFVHSNTADAIAVQTWASRGIHLVGFEIKCVRNDWTRELRKPGKPEDIQQYCRFWYVVTPAKTNVIELGEIPETWGHIEVNGNGTKIIKEAPKREEEPPDMFLLASILRNAFRGMVPKDEVDDRIAQEVKDRTEQMRKSAQYQLEDLREKVSKFEAASGVSIADKWNAGPIGEAVKAITSMNGDLLALARRVREEHAKAVEGLDAMLAEVGVDTPQSSGDK